MSLQDVPEPAPHAAAVEVQDLAATLARSPGWAQASAYERTKRCCAELTRLGERLPSWMALREIIGKGSSGDINRAKADFRREHAETLQRMDGFTEGLPAELAPLVVGFWSAAVDTARAGFEQQAQQWRAQVEQSDAAREQADAEREREVERARVLEATIVGLRESLAATEQRAHTERAAREQAERMAAAQTAELVQQRERLEAALKDGKVEMSKLVERFDAERRYAMMQIEEARARTEREVAAERARGERERVPLELDLVRLRGTVAELRGEAQEARQEAGRRAEEIAALRLQLEQSAVKASAHTPRLRKDRPRSPPADKPGARRRLRSAR